MLRINLIILICACTVNSAEPNNPREAAGTDQRVIKRTLAGLEKAADSLKTYQCRFRYSFIQPLFESKTVREGTLYYKKNEKFSKLRINFDLLRQDDAEPETHLEQYMFDGVWLTHLDYQLKQAKMYQQTEPNQPIDAFELASQNFPIIGFTDINELKKNFDIELSKDQKEDYIRLKLRIRPDSDRTEDYESVDFWLDRKNHLPARIVTVNSESDIYEINLLKPKINREITEETFRISIPEDFGKPEIFLKED